MEEPSHNKCPNGGLKKENEQSERWGKVVEDIVREVGMAGEEQTL